MSLKNSREIDIQLIQNQIPGLQSKLESLKLENLLDRSYPEDDEEYSYIDRSGVIRSAVWVGTEPDVLAFDSYNCFVGKRANANAANEFLRTKTRRKLESLARHLNDLHECENF